MENDFYIEAEKQPVTWFDRAYLRNHWKTNEGAHVILMDHVPGRISRFFGATDKKEKYVGNGENWHRADDGVECNSSLKRILNSHYRHLEMVEQAWDTAKSMREKLTEGKV